MTMAYRKLLVPLNGTERDNQVLAAAFEIAKPAQAHVTGIYVRPDAAEVLPYLGEGISASVLQEIMDAARAAAARSAAAARGSLDQFAKKNGAAMAGATGLSASFCLRDGSMDVVISEEARLSDLVIFPLPGSEGHAALRQAIETTLMHGRSPVLLVPQTPAGVHGTKAVVAWDGSATAARAVAAAIPLLKAASAIEIVSISTGSIQTAEMDRLRDYLRLHGLTATEHGVNPGGQPTGAVLMDVARRAGAGVVVLGGYGHSRWRELVLGGVTRHVLSEATMPVFMAH
jgi:nucleotide-binding universal stress UspA family protein